MRHHISELRWSCTTNLGSKLTRNIISFDCNQPEASRRPTEREIPKVLKICTRVEFQCTSEAEFVEIALYRYYSSACDRAQQGVYRIPGFGYISSANVERFIGPVRGVPEAFGSCHYTQLTSYRRAFRISNKNIFSTSGSPIFGSRHFAPSLTKK